MVYPTRQEKIMIPRTFALILTAALAVGGCTSFSGGISAAHLVRGKIDGAYYTSPDNSFRVMMPHVQGTTGFHGMAIDEKIIHDAGQTSTLVSFGPSRSDPNIYRVRVTRSNTESPTRTAFLDAAKADRSRMIEQAESKHDALLTKFHSGKILIDDRETFFAAYRQPVQQGVNLDGRSPTRVRYHAMYFMNYGDAEATFWVEMPIRSWEAERDVAARIERQQVSSINRFVSSLALSSRISRRQPSEVSADTTADQPAGVYLK